MAFRFDAITRRFRKPPRVIALYWTAGIGDPEQVARTLTSNRCSIHYVVGVGGARVQMASLERRCVHIGELNDDAIGIEVVCPGLPGGPRTPATRRQAELVAKERARGVVRDEYVDTIRGAPRALIDYTEAQAIAVVDLVEELCERLSIPRRVPVDARGELVRGRLSSEELAAFAGVLGHFHVHPTKYDPGTRPLERLRLRWKPSPG